MKSCVVFGAGIAGLSAAHVLAKAGIQVTVVEKLDTPGGLARSHRDAADKGVPSEYSWRGAGPWYTNLFTLMQQIPASAEGKTVYDELSREVSFQFCTDEPDPNSNSFRFSSLFDQMRGLWEMAKVFVADKRSSEQYSTLRAKTELAKSLSTNATKTIGAVLGPWVGSDETRCSVHHAGKFFQRNIYPQQRWTHKDEAGTWVQKGGSEWVVFNGPTNEVWFDPWVTYLQRLGVQFVWKTSLVEFETRTSFTTRASTSVESAIISRDNNSSGQQRLTADAYICAINPYAAAQIVPGIDAKFATNTPPHIQISFQVVFTDKKIQLPPPRTAIILVDSPFDITFYAQDQLWSSGTTLGEGVQSLWSGTCTVDSTPGLLYGKPMRELTKEELILEITAQLRKSKVLASTLSKYNGGNTLDQYTFRIQVWNSWMFPAEEKEVVTSLEPKWVNSVAVKPGDQPTVNGSIVNLRNAGAHVQTSADLYSMEAAAESGIDAAHQLFPSIVRDTSRQRVPLWLGLMQTADNVCYACGLPNVLYVLLFALIYYFVFC